MGVRDERTSSVSLDWRETVRTLSERPADALSGAELDTLADGLFWTDRLQDSIAARRDAYARYVAARDDEGAAMAAWRLFYEHWLVGEVVVGRTWLERARSLIVDRLCAPAGWVSIADADVAMAEGDAALAVRHGQESVDVARGLSDPDLTAMALQAAGRAEVMHGDSSSGLQKLDQAMILVISNDLDPHYTGWVYCNVIATCHAIADLRRANEWSDAAMKWCTSLREGLLYPGLCRVYSAELAALRGDWVVAESRARRACEDLLAHDERYAGAAHYTVGELARLRGAFDEAETFYERAHRLGYLPQPGLALMRFSQGEEAEALRALRSALRPGPSAPLSRAKLVSATADVAVAMEDAELIEVAGSEMARLAATVDSRVVASMAQSVEAWIEAWKGSPGDALEGMRRALGAFAELQLPYEAARERVRIGTVARRMGDGLTARMEFSAACTLFEQLGAGVDQRAVSALLDELDGHRVGDGASSFGLTAREVDVLRLVAAGHTNREVAGALFLSRHTVARHLGNIYTKLGVGSRAAATARAYDQGLLRGTDSTG